MGLAGPVRGLSNGARVSGLLRGIRCSWLVPDPGVSVGVVTAGCSGWPVTLLCQAG